MAHGKSFEISPNTSPQSLATVLWTPHYEITNHALKEFGQPEKASMPHFLTSIDREAFRFPMREVER